MNSGTGLPVWLEQARERLEERGRIEAVDDWPHIPEVGDLRVAGPIIAGEVDPRLVVVTSVDPDRGFAVVALASTDVELISETDIVVARTESRLPFDLAIETDVVDRLWFLQLGRVVGRFDPEIAGIVCRAVSGEPDAIPNELKGAVIGGPADGRLDFKRQEREALDALAGGFGSSPDANLEPSVLIDPGLLSGRAGGSEEGSVDRMLDVAATLARSPMAAVPVEAVGRYLEESGCLEDTWIARQGHDVHQSLAVLFERALADPPGATPRAISLHPPRKTASELVEQELCLMVGSAGSSGVRSIKLVTDPEFWEGEFPGQLAMAEVRGGDGSGTLQVVRQRLEAV